MGIIMKKRIGSREYNTDSAELIAQTVMGEVYRKKTRGREWFLRTDETILPLEDAEARAMLGENVYKEKPDDRKRVMIGVDLETHNIIAKKAKQEGKPISDIVRQMAKNLI